MKKGFKMLGTRSKGLSAIKKYIALLLAFVMIALTGITGRQLVVSAAGKGELKAYFLNVGEGNATLLESGGRYAMIDGGVNAKSSYVVAYLKKQGVTKLDYVIASHYDADHIAGLVGVLNVFEVGEVLGPDYTADTKIYRSFVNISDQKGLDIRHPEAGDELRLGDATLHIVGPTHYGHKDENEDSVAVKVSLGKTSILICGDAGAESEGEMVRGKEDLSADLYLVNHHGSETSTSQTFLDKVNPAYAVISSGTSDNNYNHPREVTLQRLKAKNVQLYRTDKQGEILATSDGEKFTFAQEPCNDFTPGGDAAEDQKAGNQGSENQKGEDAGLTAQEDTGIDNAVATCDYVLNTKSRKFHKPECQSVKRMKDKNKEYFTGSRDELIEDGYDPCGSCKP